MKMIVTFDVPPEVVSVSGFLSFELDDAEAVLFWLESQAAELRANTRPEWETVRDA